MPFGELQPLVDALRSGDAVLRAAGMEPAALQLPGTAFFPVGRGLTIPGDWSLQTKSVLVLGQDFGTVAYLRQRLEWGKDGEADSATWRELNTLLPAAGIPLEDCFFTNAYLGLRQDGPMVGALPAIKNDAYRRWCEDFWHIQVAAQQPALVIALGKEPARFLGRIVPELAAWNSTKTYAVHLESGDVLRSFPVAGRTATAVSIPHPSFLHANAGRCRWKGARGRAALELLLAEAYQRARSLFS